MALTLALSSSASADEVVVQDADVVNVGVAGANSGGNLAIANASDNEATTNQGAVGAIASNTATTGGGSDGTATITTGAATAKGTESTSDVAQDVATGDDAGVTVNVQTADVVNLGAAGANSGFNAAVGNASDNEATTNQGAIGFIASNTATTGAGGSDGTATITTGAATASGVEADTAIAQGVSGDGGGGVGVFVQDSDVINLGLAGANSGFNLAIGNTADNEATTNQGAIGFIASNTATTGGSSNGTSSINTGAATATGVSSRTGIGQTIATEDPPPGVTVAVQNDFTLDLGLAGANTGINASIANDATDSLTTSQGAVGVIATNTVTTGGVSDGTADVGTGTATAIGTLVATEVEQIII